LATTAALVILPLALGDRAGLDFGVELISEVVCLYIITRARGSSVRVQLETLVVSPNFFGVSGSHRVLEFTAYTDRVDHSSDRFLLEMT
jgi:hypothetical protein